MNIKSVFKRKKKQVITEYVLKTILLPLYESILYPQVAYIPCIYPVLEKQLLPIDARINIYVFHILYVICIHKIRTYYIIFDAFT